MKPPDQLSIPELKRQLHLLHRDLCKVVRNTKKEKGLQADYDITLIEYQKRMSKIWSHST